jgi:hypothetical protein
MLVFGVVVILLGDLLLLDLGGTASRLAAMARRRQWFLKGRLSNSVWPWRALGGLVATVGLAIVVIQALAP